MQNASGSPETALRFRQRPLVQEVRDELERMILGGEVEAGERLNEIDLARQMGVSRGPVREAARSLEREGLVRAVANQGVYVRKLSLEDALELYDLRALMAGELCASVAARPGARVRADLRDLVETMDDLIARDDQDSYFTANLAFHDHIAAAADLERTRSLYVALGKEVRLFRLRVLNGLASLVVSNAEHRRILAAIEAGDVETARSEGRDHHLNGKRRLLETLDG